MFSMDCLAIIILFVMNHYIPPEKFNELLEKTDRISVSDKWSKDRWQETIYSSYKNLANENISDDINLNIVFCLNKILQNCYFDFDFIGWNAFIDVCHTLIKKDDDIVLFENGNIRLYNILLTC